MKFLLTKFSERSQHKQQNQLQLCQILCFICSFTLITVKCSVEVKEIRRRIVSNEEEFIQLKECKNSFFINKQVENEEFLMTSELMSSYQFHKIKDEESSMIRVGDQIIILDQNFKFLKLSVKYNKSNHVKNEQVSITSGGSFDFQKIIQGDTKQQQVNSALPLSLKLIDAFSLDYVFIHSGKKIYRVDLDNPLDSITRGNHLFYFQDKEWIDDIVFYKYQEDSNNRANFYLASNGSVYIYDYNLYSQQLKYSAKLDGLSQDLLQISKMCIFNDLLLVVDQKNGIFFFGLPNNAMRSQSKRLPMFIEASDVVDVFVNQNTIIVVESEESNSVRVIITEYFYNIESSTVIEVKELSQRYSNYQSGYLTASKFYFISNFVIHYIHILESYSRSAFAVSSKTDSDDFNFSEDKVITNSESVRIHNFLIIDPFYDFANPLFVGLERKKINVYSLEYNSPSVEIKFNREQFDQEQEEERVNRDELQSKFGKNQKTQSQKSDYQSNEKRKQQEQLTTTCALFDCSEYEKYLQQQVSIGALRKDSFTITTKFVRETDVSVFKNFCLVTTEIDIIEKEVESWLVSVIKNRFLYYGLVSSLLSIPFLYYAIKFTIRINCKYQLNIDIFTPKIKKQPELEGLVKEKLQIQENHQAYDLDQIQNRIQNDVISFVELEELPKGDQIEIKRLHLQKPRNKKLEGVNSVGNAQAIHLQKKRHPQTASVNAKDHITQNPINFYKESVKQPNAQKKPPKDKSVYKSTYSQSVSTKASQRSITLSSERQKSINTQQVEQQSQNSQYPPKNENQTDCLKTEILGTEHQTEGDENQCFRVTKIEHND